MIIHLIEGYFIIPASGDSTNIKSTSTTFPGSTNQTSFINSTLKNGTPTGKSLISIAYGADSVISFSYINNAPTITILPITNITTTSATLNGNVTGSGITSKGFEYRVLGNTNFTQQSVNNNPLQLTLNNLLVNTNYEYRIYVTTSFGIIYSPIETFSTDCGIILNPPFTESFETNLTCWNQISSDTNYLNVVSYGSSPSCSPYGGTKMLKYNSYNIYANKWAALFTPKINFTNNSTYNLNLWIYRTNNTYSKQNEGIEIYINSSRDLDSATLIGFISNDRTAIPSTNSDGWYNYLCSLPSSISGNYYLIFKAKSEYGNNIYIDDISLTQTLILPPTLSYDSTTNITHNSATFNASYTQGNDTINSTGFKYKSLNDTTWTILQSSNSLSPLNANVNSLIPNNKYNVKSFLNTQLGNYFESQIDTFTTNPILPPTVTTNNVIVNNNTKSATFQGTIIQGTDTIISSGFQYKIDTSDWSNSIELTSSLTSTITSFATDLLVLNYNVRAFAETNSGKTYGDVLDFEITSSIKEINKDNISINLYPNPASTEATLSIKGINGNATISITDIQGRTVSNIEKEGVNGEIKHSINTDSFAKGVYYIQIQNNKSIKTQKLIIQ